MKITKENVRACKSLRDRHLAKAEDLEKKAESCEARQRGGYLSHAAQRRKSARRMQNNYEYQMAWLAMYNPTAHKEMIAEETNEPTI